MIAFFNNYWRIILVIISSITFLITVIKLILNSYAIGKIQNNELYHINKDIDNLKKEDKDFKKGMKNEIHNIFLAIKRIEKKQTIRDTVCNLRHKNNKQ